MKTKLSDIIVKSVCVAVFAVSTGSDVFGVDMPSRKDVEQAEKEVLGAITDIRQGVVSGKLSNCDAAKLVLNKAECCSNLAQKILLQKGAVVLFAQGGDFESAEMVFVAMTNSVVMPVRIQINILDQALRNVSSANADRMAIMVGRNISLVRVDELLLKLKTDPENVLLHRRIGEQYVILGDWDSALEHFARSGGEYAKMAIAERTGASDLKDIGDFWWLESNDVADLLHEGYRIHARHLYGKSPQGRANSQGGKK